MMDAWQRPDRCADNGCVEVAYVAACDTGACVEVLPDGDRVLVRATRPGPSRSWSSPATSGWRSSTG